MNSAPITRQGINHLAANLNQLSNLAELTLELINSSDEVYEQAQAQIETAIRKLPQLKQSDISIG